MPRSPDPSPSLPAPHSAVDPQRPRLAISAGDPLGIGPEIIVKALADPAVRALARFRIFARAHDLDKAAARAGLRFPYTRLTPETHTARSHDEHPPHPSHQPHDVLVVDHREFDLGAADQHAPGPNAIAGRASFRFIEEAIAAAKRPHDHPAHVDAIVTAPISKTSWSLGGLTQFPGHTELLADRFHAPDSGMLFVGPALTVMLATIHVPLSRVPQMLTTPMVLRAITLAHRAAIDLGHASPDRAGPRIAVCGLNPHAGEHGLLGAEDDAIIAPAIAHAKAAGINAAGPFPADTIFRAAARPPIGQGRFDAVVAMYHDQGLIPVKLADGPRTVNMTVGLPTIRTSPAHGTAFDIAGTNAADPTSMIEAIKLATSVARARSK